MVTGAGTATAMAVATATAMVDDDVDPEDTSGSTAANGNSGKLSKKAALQKRLAALHTKINQSRTLN